MAELPSPADNEAVQGVMGDTTPDVSEGAPFQAVLTAKALAQLTALHTPESTQRGLPSQVA